MSTFQVRFWGTRGSIPAPGPATRRYGGNTSCVEVRCGRNLFICDAGTGIRELGDKLMARGSPIAAHVFITHTHWDHIQGFPFFVPAYVPSNAFRIYGAHGIGDTFEAVFRRLMDPSYFPADLGDMSAALEFTQISGEPFNCGGVSVRTFFTNHPGVDVAYQFILGKVKLTYLTDHETYQAMDEATEFARGQDRLVEEFCRGSDLLICDAQYTEDEYRAKRRWGHSRYKDAVQLGLAAGVQRLALFHHDPSHDDARLDAVGADAAEIVRTSGKPMDCFLARDGMELEV